jgi:hypothetical protein
MAARYCLTVGFDLMYAETWIGRTAANSVTLFFLKPVKEARDRAQVRRARVRIADRRGEQIPEPLLSARASVRKNRWKRRSGRYQTTYRTSLFEIPSLTLLLFLDPVTH